MRTRAERRHLKERARRRARRIAVDVLGYGGSPEVVRWFERNCDNVKACSNHCCGNPRRFEKDKLTRQEKLHAGY